MAVTQTETLTLTGQACSGLGEGAAFTTLPWVQRECLAKLGFAPYPGTFNLRMGGPDWDAARRVMVAEPGIAITPAPGFCAAKCYHVLIGGCITGAVVFPEVGGYPSDKFEVISAVPVRQALGIADGDSVAVNVVR